MKILYWNIAQNRIGDLLREIAIEQDIDMLILSECPDDIAYLLTHLNNSNPKTYKYVDNSLSRERMFVSFLPSLVDNVLDVDHLSIRKVNPPLGDSFLMALVHLPSKMYERSKGQALYATRIERYIEEQERKHDHERTVVVGDFNMNPFEVGLVGPEAFHAVPHRRIAVREARMIYGERKPYYYNPMWNYLGDKDRIGGTFYSRV